MVTCIAHVPGTARLTARYILRALEPEWDRGWAVQFGTYLVRLPSAGDVTFYDRLAANGLDPVAQRTTYRVAELWPHEPTFGASTSWRA